MLRLSGFNNANLYYKNNHLIDEYLVSKSKDCAIEDKENTSKNQDISLKEALDIKNNISFNGPLLLDEILDDEPTTPRKNNDPKVVTSAFLTTYSPEYSKIKYQNKKFIPLISKDTINDINKKNGEINYVFKDDQGQKYPGEAVDGLKRVKEHCTGFVNPSPQGKIRKSHKGKFHATAAKKMVFTEGALQPLKVGFLPPIGVYKTNKDGTKSIKTLKGYHSEKIWIAALKTQEKGYSIRSGGNGRLPIEKAKKREAKLVISDLTNETVRDKKKFKVYLAKLRQTKN